MFVHLFTFVAFSIASVSSMTVCNNSLFTTPNEWGAASGSWFNEWIENGFNLPKTAISKPNSKYMTINNTCIAYSKRKEVCCSTNTLEEIAHTVESAKSAIATAVKVLKDEKVFAKQIISLVGPAIETFCPSNSRNILPGNICEKLTATVTTYTQQIVDDATRIASDQARCVSALTTYAAGMACMACDVEFNKYVDLEKMVINLAENTCTQVYGACVQTIQNDVNSLFQTVNNFVSALLNDVSGCGDVCKDLIPKEALEDMCGGTIKSPGDCKHYVCYEMLDGLSSNAWLDWTNILSSIPVTRLLRDDIDNLSEKEKIELFKKEVIDAPRRLHESILTRDGNKKANERRMMTAASHSKYLSKGGYDPYAIGCQDTKTCDGFPWFGLIGIVVVACTIIGLAFFIKTKGLNNTKNSNKTRNQSKKSKNIDAGYGTLP